MSALSVNLDDLCVRVRIKCRLVWAMLGTNSVDVDIHKTHVIDKQRDLFLKKGKLMKEIGRYEQILISDEKEKDEIEGLLNNLEALIGGPIPEDIREEVLLGKLDRLKKTMKEIETRGVTCFFKDEEGKPWLSPHMMTGFLKGRANALLLNVPKRVNKDNDKVFLKSMAFTDAVIRAHVSIEEKRITVSQDIIRGEDKMPAYLVRSLRFKDKESGGETTTIAKSEMLPEGTEFGFTYRILKGSPVLANLETLLALGELQGIGQWRGAGWGRFEVIEYKVLDDEKLKAKSFEAKKKTIEEAFSA